MLFLFVRLSDGDIGTMGGMVEEEKDETEVGTLVTTRGIGGRGSTTLSTTGITRSEVSASRGGNRPLGSEKLTGMWSEDKSEMADTFKRTSLSAWREESQPPVRVESTGVRTIFLHLRR